MATGSKGGTAGYVLVSEVDQFDIDLRFTTGGTLLTNLAQRAQLEGEDTIVEPEDPGQPEEPLLPTAGEFTCEPGCDISGVPECHPDPETTDCCEGGASVIPISGDDFTCDCPESATCPSETFDCEILPDDAPPVAE